MKSPGHGHGSKDKHKQGHEPTQSFSVDRHHPHPIITRSMFSMSSFNADKDLPIVYCPEYNISIFGLELLHQFDTRKYEKIAETLSTEFLDTPYARHEEPNEQHSNKATEHHSIKSRALVYLKPNRPISIDELSIHHSNYFIDHLHNDKSWIARVTEVWLLNLTPRCLIDNRLLQPLKWQVSGTIFAAHLAMQHGWSINLGGGFHQASENAADTFCLMSDVCLAMKYVWRKHPLQKFMVIDLDAHQATGIERDISQLSPKLRKLVYMVDVFNSSINPPDQHADQGIDVRVELGRFTGDLTYIQRLDEALKSAFSKFKPSLIFYIAGQDVLKDDQLGLLNLTDDGLRKRDEVVFSWATERIKCPIVMLLGGGYIPRGARVQVNSIRNLYSKGLIWGGHRSGSRTLTRPRNKLHSKDKGSGTGKHKNGTHPKKIKPTSNATLIGKNESNPVISDAVSIQEEPSKETNDKITTVPPGAKVVRVAPVDSKFLKHLHNEYDVDKNS